MHVASHRVIREVSKVLKNQSPVLDTPKEKLNPTKPGENEIAKNHKQAMNCKGMEVHVQQQL